MLNFVTQQQLKRIIGLWFAAASVACGSSAGGGSQAVDSSAEADVADTQEQADTALPPDTTPEDIAQDTAVNSCHEQQLHENVQIPTRDLKTLAAVVRRPVDPNCKVPTIFVHTPYKKENTVDTWLKSDTPQPLFDDMNYAVVISDWRGFWGSKSAAKLKPKHGEDGHDIVEWIASQTWSNEKVGTFGVSALCRVQIETAIENPHGLVAAVPIFCAMNNYYEQYYPGGVLRREYAEFITAYFSGGVNRFEQYPYYNNLWQASENTINPADVKIPLLVVSGWWDLWNTGTFRSYQDLVQNGAQPAKSEHRLLVGPWIHFAAGAETTEWGGGFSAQEKLYFDTGQVIQTNSLAFFDRHLRGLETEAADWAPVRYEQAGEGTWQNAQSWPPETVPLTLLLNAGGTLAESAPPAGEVAFTYDPQLPSLTVGGQTLVHTHLHGPHDQKDVLEHPEAQLFVSAALTEPLRIAGPITVQLDVSTTGADTDFAVRLIDVDAAGVHLLIGEGIQRLKLRDTLSAPSEVVPGVRYSVEVKLTNELAYTFATGHSVGIIVTSSNYDRFDKNPNNGDDFYTGPQTSVSVTNTIFADGTSALILPRLTK